MAKKKSVDITAQTIYIFIPILSILALYRVEKLRWGILIAALFGIVTWGTDYSFEADDDTLINFITNGENLMYGILYMIYLTIEIAVFVYLIRKWSGEWNKKLENSNNDS